MIDYYEEEQATEGVFYCPDCEAEVTVSGFLDDGDPTTSGGACKFCGGCEWVIRDE